jgi:HSP20 family protein
MAITDLIPWKRNETNVPVRREDEQGALLDLRSQMNRMFDQFFEKPFGLGTFFGEQELAGVFSPQLDVTETDKAITISAELPGLEPEDIDISLDRDVLTIRGEKRAEKEEKGARYYRVERSYGSFCRSIPLPGEVEEDKIDASFKRGVLTVKLPKSQKAKEGSKRITVKTN